jgi:hypothetical protein
MARQVAEGASGTDRHSGCFSICRCLFKRLIYPSVVFQAEVWRRIVNMVELDCSPEGPRCLVKERRAAVLAKERRETYETQLTRRSATRQVPSESKSQDRCSSRCET